MRKTLLKIAASIAALALFAGVAFAQSGGVQFRNLFRLEGSDLRTIPDGLNIGTVANPVGDIHGGTLSISGLTLGGNLALGTNSITLTGSIGATGARSAKGWFTDLEVTNAIAGGVTGNAGTVTFADAAADTSTWVALGTGQTGSLAPATDAGLTYNSSTDALTATTFIGALTGNASTVTTNANLTGDVTSSGNATTLAAASGTVTMAENAALLVDPAMSADGKFNGITRGGTAGAALAFGDLVYLDPTDSRWELVDANSAAAADGDGRGVLGLVVLAAAGDGSATTVLLYGVIRADTAFPAFTINAPIYASETAGDVTGTQPVTTDVVIRTLGFGLTADEMLFAPSSDYMTHI